MPTLNKETKVKGCVCYILASFFISKREQKIFFSKNSMKNVAWKLVPGLFKFSKNSL